MPHSLSHDEAAEEARERLAALQRIRRDFATEIDIARQSLKWLTAEQADHLREFLNGVQDLMGDDLFLAERLAQNDHDALECKLERRHERESAPVVL